MRVNADTIYETEQYFLEDEPYETISHLITSYVGVDRCVSAASGARICRPVNRTTAIGRSQPPAPAGQGGPAARLSWRRSLLGRGRRVGSAEQLTAGRLGSCSSGSLPRLSAASPLYQQPGRLRADQLSPPPKPSRFDGRVYEEIPELPPAGPAGAGSGSDSGHGSGDSASDNPAAPRPPPPPSGPALAPVDLSPPSAFDVASFETLLLPLTHNAPLDGTALRGVTLELLETEPAPLAVTLTSCDLQLLHGDGRDRGLGVTCGIELLTLPQGHQLRQDLLERWVDRAVKRQACYIGSLEGWTHSTADGGW